MTNNEVGFCLARTQPLAATSSARSGLATATKLKGCRIRPVLAVNEGNPKHGVVRLNAVYAGCMLEQLGVEFTQISCVEAESRAIAGRPRLEDLEWFDMVQGHRDSATECQSTVPATASTVTDSISSWQAMTLTPTPAE